MNDTTPGALDGLTKRRRVVFDPTINLGHVLTFLGFVATGSVAYFDLKQSQAVMSVRVEMLAREVEAEKVRTGNAIVEIKTDMKEMRGEVRQIVRGVDQLTEKKP